MEVPLRNTHSTIAGLQRLVDEDGDPVLRLRDETERVEQDGGMFAKRFDRETQ